MPSIDEIKELGLFRFSERKISEIKSKLSREVGLIVKRENGLLISIKADAHLIIQRNPDTQNFVVIVGLSNSEADARDFETEFGRLEHSLGDLFSPRELNYLIVQDFIREYLTRNLYESRSEKSIAFEFLVMQVQKSNDESSQIYVQLIDFRGEVSTFEADETFRIFGCTNLSRRKKLAEAFKNAKVEELPTDRIREVFEQTLKSYEDDTDEGEEPFVGDYTEVILDFHQDEDKK